MLALRLHTVLADVLTPYKASVISVSGYSLQVRFQDLGSDIDG